MGRQAAVIGNQMRKQMRANGAFVASIAVVLLCNGSGVVAQTRQEHVHHGPHSVMQFDTAKTVHIFKMNESVGSTCHGQTQGRR